MVQTCVTLEQREVFPQRDLLEKSLEVIWRACGFTFEATTSAPPPNRSEDDITPHPAFDIMFVLSQDAVGP